MNVGRRRSSRESTNRRRRAWIPCLVGVVAATVCIPSAWAAFASPVDLSAPGRDAREEHVAADGKGNGIAVWSRFDGTNWRVQARLHGADGTLGPVHTMSPPGVDASFPHIAIDTSNNAVVVWDAFDTTKGQRVQLRRLSAGGTLGATQTVAGGSGSTPAAGSDVAVDGGGNATVVWVTVDGSDILRVQARRVMAGGTLGPKRTLSAAGQFALSPDVGVDATGNSVITWMRSDGANLRVQARRLAADSTLSTTKTLSASGQDAQGPTVAVDPAGNATVAWQRSDGTNTRIQARRRAPDGTLGPTKTLSAAGQDAIGPAVAVGSGGNATVAWCRFDGSRYRVQARHYAVTGTLGARKTLSASGIDAIAPNVAADGAGNSTVAWLGVGGSLGPDSRVQARRLSDDGTQSSVQTLSAAGQAAGVDPSDPMSFRGPTVAASPTGGSTVVWHRFDGANLRVQSSSGSL